MYMKKSYNKIKVYPSACGFKDGVEVFIRKTKAGNDSFLVCKEKEERE